MRLSKFNGGTIVTVETARKYNFEVGMYRPPSEGGSQSLLLRFTRNCPWNKCTFCAMYKHEKFSMRSVAEIKADIDAIAGMIKEIVSAGDVVRDIVGGYSGIVAGLKD